MRRFSRSDAYVRIRLVNAIIFMVLGALVGVRTFAVAGIMGKALPAYVLAAAMIGLGAFRLRTYFQLRAQQR
jgi:hypothetical protein